MSLRSMMNVLRGMTELSLVGLNSSCSTAYVFVSAKCVSTSPCQKMPRSACAIWGTKMFGNSPIAAYQMLSTLQAEPINQCCHWIVGARDRTTNIVVWREKPGIKLRNIYILLRCELSGGQEHLPSYRCGNINVVNGFGCLEVCVRYYLVVKTLSKRHSHIMHWKWGSWTV